MFALACFIVIVAHKERQAAFLPSPNDGRYVKTMATSHHERICQIECTLAEHSTPGLRYLTNVLSVLAMLSKVAAPRRTATQYCPPRSAKSLHAYTIHPRLSFAVHDSGSHWESRRTSDSLLRSRVATLPPGDPGSFIRCSELLGSRCSDTGALVALQRGQTEGS